MTNDDHSPAEVYDALADHWSDFAESPTREYVEWPAVRSLLPDVEDKRVLDAGCGDGTFSGWLAEKEADVLGIDASGEMIRVARKRFGDHVEFRQADLRVPLDFVPDDSLDLVLCQLAFSHIPDIAPVVAEFARVLVDDGVLVVSTHHPFHDFLVAREREHPDMEDAYGVEAPHDPDILLERDPPRYHDIERYGIDWAPGAGSSRSWYHRRPLGRLVGPILDAGFRLSGLVEPKPDERFEAEHPDVYETFQHRPPEVVCLRAELS